MQKQKEAVRALILSSAEEIFLCKGFLKTSMRDISCASGVGLSNIYNYFSNKDDLFAELLKPVITHLYGFIYKHNVNDFILDYFTDSRYRLGEIREYVELICTYRKELRLLLFCAEGSSLSTFREKYTDKMTEQILGFFADLRNKYPHVNAEVSPFFLHVNVAWWFTLLEEAVMHCVGRKELEKIMSDYITFETAGWKELIDK